MLSQTLRNLLAQKTTRSHFIPRSSCRKRFLTNTKGFNPMVINYADDNFHSTKLMLLIIDLHTEFLYDSCSVLDPFSDNHEVFVLSDLPSFSVLIKR